MAFDIPRNKTQPWFTTEYHKIMEKILDYFRDVGLGSMAQQDADDVEITGGTITNVDITGGTMPAPVSNLMIISTSSNQNNGTIESATIYKGVSYLLGANITVSGYAAPASAGDYREVVIANSDGEYTVTLAHDSSNSDAANRIKTPDGNDLVIPPREHVKLIYNHVEDCWRLLSKSWASSGDYGNYTPTAITGVNVTDVTGLVGRYSKIGDIVTVSVRGIVTFTSADVASSFFLTLPVAPTLVGGTFSAYRAAGSIGYSSTSGGSVQGGFDHPDPLLAIAITPSDTGGLFTLIAQYSTDE